MVGGFVPLVPPILIMSKLVEFIKSVNNYKRSRQELIKFNNFIKRHVDSKICDLSAFSGGDYSFEILEREMNSLLEEGERNKWDIHINSFLITENRISVKLIRTSVIRSVFTEVSDCQLSYGITNVFNGKVYRISCSECKGLTQLRMSKAAQVVAALVVKGGACVVTDSRELEEDSVETIYLSHTASSSHTILVSVVRTSSDQDLFEADLTQLRTSDMLAMSEHKSLSEKSIRQLVDAAITFDMLSVKLEKPICLELSSQPKPARQSNCKGAPFVLYNYTRLHAILERYNDGVSKGIYPQMPSVHDINYNLLSSEDEWSLVYDLVAEWPSVVAECQNLGQPPLHRLTSYLSALASTFSVYYRHTRVLNEGLKHMLPLMEARIHLLQTIKQVFLVAFSILGIDPLIEM